MANPVPVDDESDGVGIKPGLYVWYMDDSDVVKCVRLPRAYHGVLYSGCGYVILRTIGKEDSMRHQLWAWMGEDGSTEQANCLGETVEALIRTLDKSRTMVSRKFQSDGIFRFPCFDPCTIFRIGRFVPDAEDQKRILYEWNMGHGVLQEVVCDHATLGHDKILVLDTKTKIFQFNGSETPQWLRANIAKKVVPHINDRYHDGKCDIAIVEDGTHDADNFEFWSFFGESAPSNSSIKNNQTKLFSVLNGQVKALEVLMRRDILDTNNCYLLQLNWEYGIEVYVWMGRKSLLKERKFACEAAKKLASSFHRSDSVVIRVIEGFERIRFRSEFEWWLFKKDVVVSKDNKGEGTGAGVNEKTLLEAANVDSIASLRVWCWDGDGRSPLMGSEVIKFCSRYCYIFSYSYTGELGEQHVVGTWFGRQSLEGDKLSATLEAKKIAGSLDFCPVQISMFEGNEPIGFLSISQNLIVCKGGHSEAGIALFKIQRIGSKNMKAIQVEAVRAGKAFLVVYRDVNTVASSLHSSYCYVLRSESSSITWFGKDTTLKDRKFLKKKLYLFKVFNAEQEIEGSESEMFWDYLGGKQDYFSPIARKDNDALVCFYLSHKSKDHPHFKFNEIDDFDKDLLRTEEVCILTFEFDIYVWVGHVAFPKDDFDARFNALCIVQDFLDYKYYGKADVSSFSIFTIREGSEPMTFRQFFVTPLAEHELYSLISSVTTFETLVKGNEFQKEVLEFALERNLLELFFKDQNTEDVQKTRDYLLMSLKRIRSSFRVSGSKHVEDPNNLFLAVEANEFMRKKMENRKRP